VFLGGINVYLEHRSRLWRKLPSRLTRLVDAPWLIKLATRFGVSNEAQELAALTLELLSGEQGPQARELDDLVRFLTDDLKPDAILFSNVLLSGAAVPLRRSYAGSIWCVLQGDDIFLEALPAEARAQAIAKISQNATAFSGFLTHSQYYSDFMARYLSLPAERFRQVPLSIDLAGHDGVPKEHADGSTVGYFARICPEKGLHVLLDAFRRLHERQPQAKLVAGGYLGKRDVPYLRRLEREHRTLGDAFRYAGSPATHAEKVSLIRTFNVLSVPTTYHEPKGLYVLEALANGIPVVQPAHGAFPELIQATGGGLLFEPGDTDGHAQALERLLLDEEQRLKLATAGYAAVRSKFADRALVEATRRICQSSPSSEKPTSIATGTAEV
jgi:glycosyltransferase involved in cell wall biosynthesis